MSGEEWYPIPDFPGYSISRLGQVRSIKGRFVLSHDREGRVFPRKATKEPVFIGELLTSVGLLKDSPSQANAELERRLELARRVNGHLLELVAQLRKHISQLEKNRPRRKQQAPSSTREEIHGHALLDFDAQTCEHYGNDYD